MAIAVLNEGHVDPPINNGYASTPTPLAKPRFSVPLPCVGLPLSSQSVLRLICPGRRPLGRVHSMSRLRLEFEVLVGRMAGEFQDKRNGSLVFLINQYDHIVNTLNVRTARG